MSCSNNNVGDRRRIATAAVLLASVAWTATAGSSSSLSEGISNVMTLPLSPPKTESSIMESLPDHDTDIGVRNNILSDNKSLSEAEGFTIRGEENILAFPKFFSPKEITDLTSSMIEAAPSQDEEKFVDPYTNDSVNEKEKRIRPPESRGAADSRDTPETVTATESNTNKYKKKFNKVYQMIQEKLSATRKGNKDKSPPQHVSNEEKEKRKKKKLRESNISDMKPNLSQLKRLSKEEVLEHRDLWGSGSGKSPYQSDFLAAVDGSWDWWQQGYRMLGGFIDCDHASDTDDQSGCSRWMMWASYVDPNYQGGGYDEYNGGDGVLDCHSVDTEWVLMGVYRQEFYQFIEQISKHLWAINEWEYIATVASLSFMTDGDCFQVSADSYGNAIYAGVEPLSGGYFQMSLYTDEDCLYPDTSLGVTYDDMGYTSNMNFGSGNSGGSNEDDNDDGGDVFDDDGMYATAEEWWYDAQEYTLTDVNKIYDGYKYCTLCMDYPTYQDGYFIGDDGTDDDDIINQCWKFHSHDSFLCEGDCMALGSAQGTVVGFNYGDYSFGGNWLTSSSSSSSSSESSSSSSSTATSSNAVLGVEIDDRWKANTFLIFSSVLFVATFLAFGVARSSLASKSRSGKSKTEILVDNDHQSEGRVRRSSSGIKHRDESKRSKSSDRRSKSRSKRRAETDTKDHSPDRRRSSSKGAKKETERPESTSNRRSRSRKSSHKDSDGRTSSRRSGVSRSRTENDHYEPPAEPQRSRSSRNRSSRSNKSSSRREPSADRDTFRDQF